MVMSCGRLQSGGGVEGVVVPGVSGRSSVKGLIACGTAFEVHKASAYGRTVPEDKHWAECKAED